MVSITNLQDFEKIYKETKYLDSLFAKKYDITSPEIIQKYNLELLVEFGELANETRCFKFWSSKEASDKQIILEEYIDCLFMILYFCNIMHVSLSESFPKTDELNIVETFLELYNLGTEFSKSLKKEIIKKLFIQTLYLSKLLNFTFEDLYEATKRKSLIIQERLKSNY